MSSPTRKVDRYGWYRKDSEKSPEQLKIETKESEKEHKREKKWQEMVSNWDFWITNKRNVVAERVRKGIPDAYRAKAWSLILGADKSPERETITIEELLKRDRLSAYDVIDVDIERTFPQIGFFSDQRILDSLKNVLQAHCQLDTDLLYTQGMGFLAGMFLIYMDEVNGFWSFHNLLSGPRTIHKDYFKPPFPRLQLANSMLRILLQKKYPEILHRLDEMQIDFQMFTPKWFMTAFLVFDWPPQMSLRIMDRFLFYGTRSLLSFALVIFSRHKSQLMSMRFEELLPLLMNPDKSPQMEDWRYVLEKWDQLWIRKKEYQNLLRQVEAPEELLE